MCYLYGSWSAWREYKHAGRGKSYEFTRKKGDRKGPPPIMAAVLGLLKTAN